MNRIAVLPYGTRPKYLGDVPLSQLRWPLGEPPDLSLTVRDLGPEDHILLYPNTWIYGPKSWGVAAQLSVMVVEPKAIHKKHMMLLRVLHRRFHRIFTCNPELLSAVPNGSFLAYGGSWVPDWSAVDCKKTKMTSLIASSKRQQEGHRLRHALIDTLSGQAAEVDILGRGYRPFDLKSDGLAPYRYSVVIENVRETNYFTEKLIDAFLCQTVPIYWGAPNIEHFFNVNGMIICESVDSLQRAVRDTSVEDYLARQSAIIENRDAATRYIDSEKTAAIALLEG